MSGPSRRNRTFSLLGAVLVTAVLVAGCSSSSNDASTSGSDNAGTTSAAVALRGSGPGQACKAAAAPTAPGEPTVEMPKVAPADLTSTDLKVGDGAEAALNDSITVSYVGISCSTGAQFDSSYGSGGPITFDLVEGRLIAGWTKGIPGMKVGGRRLLVIPPTLGYDENPPTSAILPGETLVFVVDLVAVNPSGGSATN